MGTDITLILPPTAALKLHKSRLESPEIRPVLWTPHRLPIAHSVTCDDIKLDLDPAPGGRRGQIIECYRDEPIRVLVRSRRRADQPSLWEDYEDDPAAVFGTGMAGWLAQIVVELEAGVYAYSESDGVWPVAWVRE